MQLFGITILNTLIIVSLHDLIGPEIPLFLLPPNAIKKTIAQMLSTNGCGFVGEGNCCSHALYWNTLSMLAVKEEDLGDHVEARGRLSAKRRMSRNVHSPTLYFTLLHLKRIHIYHGKPHVTQ
jgi:hypothetical protein